MGERAVLYEAADRIGLISLNRPDQRNAMTPELLDAFSEAIGEARSDDEIRCPVFGLCRHSSNHSTGLDLQSFQGFVLPDLGTQPLRRFCICLAHE